MQAVVGRTLEAAERVEPAVFGEGIADGHLPHHRPHTPPPPASPRLPCSQNVTPNPTPRVRGGDRAATSSMLNGSVKPRSLSRFCPKRLNDKLSFA